FLCGYSWGIEHAANCLARPCVRASAKQIELGRSDGAELGIEPQKSGLGPGSRWDPLIDCGWQKISYQCNDTLSHSKKIFQQKSQVPSFSDCCCVECYAASELGAVIVVGRLSGPIAGRLANLASSCAVILLEEMRLLRCSRTRWQAASWARV